MEDQSLRKGELQNFAIRFIFVKFALLVEPFWGFYLRFFSALRIFAAFVNFEEEFNPGHISRPPTRLEQCAAGPSQGNLQHFFGLNN